MSDIQDERLIVRLTTANEWLQNELEAERKLCDRYEEALLDIRANGGGRDFDAAARADDALKGTPI